MCLVILIRLLCATFKSWCALISIMVLVVLVQVMLGVVVAWCAVDIVVNGPLAYIGDGDSCGSLVFTVLCKVMLRVFY